MRLLVILGLGCFCMYIDESQELVSFDDVEYINSVQSWWVASKDWVGSRTFKDFFRGEGGLLKHSYEEYDWGDYDYRDIPAEFDARVQWPDCVVPVSDQGTCAGAGYAFASAASLSERFCIASERFTGLSLSPQYIINCGSGENACKNGNANITWSFLQSNGTVVESCVAYRSTQNNCSIFCDNGTPATLYKSGGFYGYSNSNSIQAAIYTSGSIVSTMLVYNDFFSYKSGVYVHTIGSLKSYQEVKILGWGFNSSLSASYWICTTSYGTDFGMQGYFFIKFGECGIDNSGVAGTPLI
jgi:cathepsin B